MSTASISASAYGADDSTIQCLDSGDPELCAKAYLKQAAEKGCQAACASYGVPEAGPLCGPITAVLVDALYPVAKALTVGLGNGFGELIMFFLPEAWKASGTFDPGAAIFDWYNSTQIVKTWDDTVDAILKAWIDGRKAAKLEDKPFPILPAATNPIMGRDEFKSISDMHNGLIIFGRANVEKALYGTCLSFYPKGWFSPIAWSCDAGNLGSDGELGQVKWGTSTGHLNDVGTGPFKLNFTWWPEQCDQGCKNALASGIQWIWGQRLETLRQAQAKILEQISFIIMSDIQKCPFAKATYIESVKKASPAFQAQSTEFKKATSDSGGALLLLVGAAILAYILAKR